MKVARGRAVLLLVLALFFAIGPFSFVRVLGTLLPLVESTVAVLAAATGVGPALPYALGAGIVLDLFSGRALGLNTLGAALLAALEGWLSRRIYTEEPGFLALAVAVGVFVERLALGLFLAVLHAGGGDLLRQAVLGALFSLPLTFLCRWVLGPQRPAPRGFLYQKRR